MAIRGIRGATTVPADEPGAILGATRELLQEIIRQNGGISAEDVASVLFTLTNDLLAAYPAQAARELGWEAVPLMCAQEIPVPGGLPRAIRVLLHWNTNTPQSGIRHVYLRDAAELRPDLCIAGQTALTGSEEKPT